MIELLKENDIILKRHEPIVLIGGHHIPHATPRKPTYIEHDKYQHLFTYSDETVVKHLYVNMDDEALAFNQ